MLLSIISIIINIIFYIILNINLYTDRALMPDGGMREWQRSPISRLQLADQGTLLYLQLAFAAVSMITSVLILLGAKNSIIRVVQLVSTAASIVMFIMIMIVTSNSHAKYA